MLNNERLNIQVYAGQNGSFEYYEDEGDNYGYEGGRFAISKMQWDDQRRVFTIDEREGSYLGMKSRLEIVVELFEPQGSRGQRLSEKREIVYAGKFVIVSF